MSETALFGVPIHLPDPARLSGQTLGIDQFTRAFERAHDEARNAPLRQMQLEGARLQLDSEIHKKKLQEQQEVGMNALLQQMADDPSNVGAMMGVMGQYNLGSSQPALNLFQMAQRNYMMKQGAELQQRLETGQDKLTPGETRTLETPSGKVTFKGATPKTPEQLGLERERIRVQEEKLDFDRQRLTKQIGEIGDRETKLRVQNDPVIKTANKEAQELSVQIAKLLANPQSDPDTLNTLQVRKEAAITRVNRRLEFLQPKAPSAPATPGMKLKVRRLSDGAQGTIDENDFDPAKYEKLQ